MPSLLRVPVTRLSEGVCVLSREASRYLVRVHRARTGDEFLAFDPGQALEARGALLEAKANGARCRFEAPSPSTNRPEFDLTLIQGLPKAGKVERVIRDATALGVGRIVLAQAGRSVPRPSASKKRDARLLAIAIDAARQSGRGDLPDIEGPLPLESAVLQFGSSAATKLYLDPRAEVALATRLATPAPSGAVVLFVGPEGGLDALDESALRGAGFVEASLGPFVLRTETAALAAAAIARALMLGPR